MRAAKQGLLLTTVKTPAIEFRPVTHADIPTVHEWVTRPHVAEWWGPQTYAEFEAEFAAMIDGVEPVWPFIALCDGVAIGFIQSYAPARCHDDGWWLDVDDPGARGIDQFLAEAAMLGQGLGTAMVQAFVASLFADPAVTWVQTDPDPRNQRAIRCYEKAGFVRDRVIETPDGPALVMIARRGLY